MGGATVGAGLGFFDPLFAAELCSNTAATTTAATTSAITTPMTMPITRPLRDVGVDGGAGGAAAEAGGFAGPACPGWIAIIEVVVSHSPSPRGASFASSCSP